MATINKPDNFFSNLWKSGIQEAMEKAIGNQIIDGTVSTNGIQEIPTEKKEPTLIKDIMVGLESGDRTKEQLAIMRFQAVTDSNRGSVSSGTMIMSSSAVMFRPGQVFYST